MILSRAQAPVAVSPGKEPDVQPPPSPPKEKKPVWQTADGKEGDDGKLNRLLGTLSNLRCDKYLDDIKKKDLSNPIYSMIKRLFFTYIGIGTLKPALYALLRFLYSLLAHRYMIFDTLLGTFLNLGSPIM